MDRKIKVAQYGCGKMSSYIMKYIYDKGAEIVAAFDVDKNKIGKDISSIMECENKGITIYDVKEAEKVLTNRLHQFCVVCGLSLESISSQ